MRATKWTSQCGTIEVRRGDWRKALADVEACDALITDPPYSRQTHDGQPENREAIGYQPLSIREAVDLLKHWRPRTRTWCAVMTDDVLVPVFRRTARRLGYYDFPPVPVLQHKPRQQGDGPGNGAIYLVPSRPREARMLEWGSLPGWYLSTPERDGGGFKGGKPLALMRAVLRHYTRPGDLVVDPFGGRMTTALACAEMGRRCLTCEIDPKTYEAGVARLAAGWTVDPFDAATSTEVEQQTMFPKPQRGRKKAP